MSALISMRIGISSDIKKILNRFNINVCEASNDDEVLTLFKNDPATRISLDIVLTTQLTESFSNQDLKKRTSELYPDLKATFVLICDSTHKSDYSDFSACIPKPVFPDTLHACIEQLFNSARKIPAEVQKHHCYDVASFNDSRILLVEDNLVNQKVASVILSKWKLQVDTAQNGYEALKLLSIYPYDLVLMDVQMPGLDGCKTTQLIRSGEYNVINPEIPVIAMTAHTMNGDRENCLVCGMDDYISKPFNIDQLFTILNKWISPQDNENSFSSVLSPLQTPGN
jgi:CheY-like chemotaxis protein